MDLRGYYQKIRDIAEKLAAEVVVISLAHADGGKAGVVMELARHLAAKMLVEGRVREASEEEVAAFRAQVAEAKRVADQLALAGRAQIAVLSRDELDRLRAKE